MITAYRPRILSQLEAIIRPLNTPSVLDFGSGDGYFASNISQLPGVEKLVPVDVVRRKKSIVEPQIYDGMRLPFDDDSFDLVYSVDVVHHCLDPMRALDDLMRCTKRYLLLKDHNYETFVGRWVLAGLDEIGNRRFGIPSPYLYQQKWEWVEHIESKGFRRLKFIHPMVCQKGLLGLSNGLQFAALWEKR